MLIKSESCRICLLDTGMVSLTDTFLSKGMTYSEIYYCISGYNPEDGPKDLCMSCSTELVRAFEFRNRIVEAEKDLLKKVVEIDPSTCIETKDIKIEVKKLPILLTKVRQKRLVNKNERRQKEIDKDKPKPKSQKNINEIKQDKTQSICCYCGKSMRLNSLTRHLKTIHQSEETIFICDICGTNVRQKKALIEHMQHKHMNIIFSCRYCSEVFRNRGTRRVHEIRFHTQNYKHECNICKKQFMTNSQVTKHRVVHTGEKKFRCEICGLSLTRRCNLEEHIATHSDARPFKCEICQATFKTKKALRKHANVHQEYQYECPICQQKVC